MFKLFSIFLLATIVLANTSCNTTKRSMKVTGSWINKDKVGGKKYNSVFIVVLTPNLEARTLLENDLATAAAADGIKAVKSLSVFGPITAGADTAVIASLIRKAKETGCKAIMTVATIDSKSTTKYTPSSSYYYEPYPTYGYYGNLTNYFGNAFESYYTPGYYTTDNTYFLETNLYDIDTQDILFSIQTKTMNPEEMTKASHQFTETLIQELKSNGLLKKGE